MDRTALPDDPPPAAALRACADGFYPAEAAAELLICHASWLHRQDFRNSYMHVGTSISDSTTQIAVTDCTARCCARDSSCPRVSA
jgi:hypothetical protein